METRDFGLYLAILGIGLVIYEYWFSFTPKNLVDLLYFPFSPEGDFPLYSIAILIFGILVVVGGEGGAKPNPEPEHSH